MWRRQQNRHSGQYCEDSEEEKAEAVQHHGGKPPVTFHGGGDVFLSYLVRYHSDFLQNQSKFLKALTLLRCPQPLNILGKT